MPVTKAYIFCGVFSMKLLVPGKFTTDVNIYANENGYNLES